MKLLSYNIRRGGLGREALIASVIRECEPDMVVFQEATHPEIVETLARETEMTEWAARPGYSVAFISRIGVAEFQWYRPVPMRRAFLEIRAKDIDLAIFGVHLSATHSNLTERLRMRELRSLLASIKQHSGGFHLLTGDFNTLAPGELLEHQRLPPRLRFIAWATGGRVRYKTIQMMLDAGYADGYRTLHSDPGFTFPTWDPHVRLDFIFLPTPFISRVEQCRVVTDARSVREASDHFPLLSTINTDQSAGAS